MSEDTEQHFASDCCGAQPYYDLKKETEGDKLIDVFCNECGEVCGVVSHPPKGKTGMRQIIEKVIYLLVTAFVIVSIVYLISLFL